MADRDEDRFRPKVTPPKARGAGSSSAFISRVLKQTSRAGRAIGKKGWRHQLGRPSPDAKRMKFGRGQVAARLAGRSLDARSRRAVVKTLLVNLRNASPRSTEQHLRYIERDGITRDGERGQLFDAHDDSASGYEFERQGRDDRHQFRVIVSPEDGSDIGDLKGFARDLMAQVERDLETKLEWIGVEHWDTDEPHVHLVIRGKDERGQDLIISPEYISDGMRARASELATKWLGRRSERDIRDSLTAEVSQERWTSLDRAIQAQAHDGEILVHDSSATVDQRFRAGLVVGRLDRLADMGLARKIAPLHYRLDPSMEATLRSMGERGDIVRTMQRAMKLQRREYAVFDHSASGNHIVGRVAAKGLADELRDQGYLVIDAIDGRAHYVKLPPKRDLSEFPTGAVVEVRGGVQPRPVDSNIALVAVDGVYRTDRHLARARAEPRTGLDADTYVHSHVRRLEALRRAGIVQRIEDGVWRIPPDFPAQALAFDARQVRGAQVEVRSYLSIERQIKVIGASWLDHQLVGDRPSLSTYGFGAAVRHALGERAEFLIDQKLAERRNQRVVFANGLLATLRQREIEELAHVLEGETGLRHRPTVDGQSVSGVYRRSFTLASGRMAILDDATGFSLVPWRPVIEQRVGQPMTAMVRGQFVSWEFGRNRGPSR